MFLFCGMAFVDLAHLRKEDIKGRVLSYYRQKSGSLIQVEIPVEAQGLLDDLAADTTPDSPYLFPFLDGMKTGEDAYKEYNAALDKIMDKYEAVIPYFEKALELNPNDSNTLSTLKELYFRLRTKNKVYQEKYDKTMEKLKSL